MALGGGTWLVQNKVLPGSYINFVSASKASATLSDRGTATMPITLDWGPDNEVFTVTNGEFQKDSLKIFGHGYTDEALKPLRELFANALTVHLYRISLRLQSIREAAETIFVSLSSRTKIMRLKRTRSTT